MSYQDYGTNEPSRQPGGDQEKLVVDAGRLWSGGVATALVAALVALVGLLIARGIFDVTVLTRTAEGTWDAPSAIGYAFVAAAGALIATGLMHLLILSTPRPRLFFGWIMFLIGAVILVSPFTVDTDLSIQIASATIGVVVVVAIASLVSATAARSTRIVRG